MRGVVVVTCQFLERRKGGREGGREGGSFVSN